MDDPALAWPAWKFGMRRDAIHSTLHDQYNTFQSTIQDPDAFQHDVHEIASEAATAAEFHQLLSKRRELRLNELNDSLESASCEIIANPMLVNTKQWEYALQLFRTRSLDSLVRFFSSYLPSDHPWYQSTHQLKTSKGDAKDAYHDDLPPSPRSITTFSDDMETSSHDVYSIKSMNTMSSYSDLDSEAGDDSNEQKEIKAVTAANATVDNAHNDTKNTQTIQTTPAEATDAFDDDCSSQSSGPETPDSMSDAEPDVDVTDDDAHVHSHISHVQDVQQHIASLSPKALSPKAIEKTAGSESPTPTSTSVITTPTRRSPLQPGFVVDDMRCSSPMLLPASHSSQTLPVPADVCSHQRSTSPSRPFALHAPDHYLDHFNHDSDNLIENSRIAGRMSRSRFSPNKSFAQQRLASPSRSSRRRPGVSANGGITAGIKVEKTTTPLPRPMRTRMRGRREAAIATAERD